MGNFNIDISTLGKFADYAKQADANKNNILDEIEISVFKSKITKEEIFKSNILKTDMGLLVQNSIMTQQEVDDLYLNKLNNVNKAYSKEMLTEAYDYFLYNIAKYDTPTDMSYKSRNNLKGLIAHLKEKYKNTPEDDYKYAIKQIEELEYIIENSKLDLTNKENIEKLGTKSFAKENNLTDFQKDIIKYYAAQYQSTVVDTELKKIEELYNEIVNGKPKDEANGDVANGDETKNDETNDNENKNSADAATEEKNEEQEPKKADAKINYSKSLAQLKSKLKKEGLWKNEYYRDAYEIFAEGVKREARVEFLNELQEENGTKLRKGKMKRKLAKGDKIKKKIIKKSESLINLTNRHNKFEEKIAHTQAMTADEIKKQLGKDIYRKLAKNYLGSHAVSENTYDLSELGNWLLETVGQDYKVNYSESKNAELENTKRKLDEKGVELDNTKQVKKLLKFYNFEIEGKYDAKKVPQALGVMSGGALINGAATRAVNGHFKDKTYIVQKGYSETTHQPWRGRVPVDLEEALRNGNVHLDELGNLVDISGTILVEVDILVEVIQEFPDIVKSMSMLPGVLTAATLTNAVLGALLTMPFALQMMKRQNEEDCFARQGLEEMEDNMPLNNYAEIIKKEFKDDPDAQDFYLTVAALCSYDDVDQNENKFKRIDKDEVDKLLKWMAGTGSALNCEEITSKHMFGKAEKDGLKIEPKPDCEPCPEYPDGQEDSEDPEGTGSIGNKTPEITPFTEYQCVKVDVTTYDMRNSSWNKMVQAYDSCLLEKCGNNIYLAGRVLKVIQGINPDLYNDIDTLVEIAKYSMKHGVTATETKYGEYFQNFGRFEHYINTPDLNNIILPDNIDNCEKNQDFSYKATPTQNPYKGSPYGIYQSTAKQDAQIAKYGYTDANGNEHRFDTEEERSVAIVNEISKNPKTKINEPTIRNCDN